MKLPHPEERLAGCCWLPRLAAKTRVYLAGKMPFSYRIAFGSRIGVDGFFLRHFDLSLAEVIGAVRNAPTDEALATWFLKRQRASGESIAVWNAQAVKLGAPGHPGHLTLRFIRPALYPKSIFHPVGSIFEAIAQDENLPAPAPPAGD